jgi:hypothetical protein
MSGHSSARYVYSFDRETFTGPFDSRDVAYRAAVARAHEMENTPTEIFVGQQIPGNPQASDHACHVIERMRLRARAAVGEQADEYLRRVTDQEEAELDEAIEDVIAAWLQKHDRAPKFFDVRGISEYPVPTPPLHPSRNGEQEVSEIGESEYPLGR